MIRMTIDSGAEMSSITYPDAGPQVFDYVDVFMSAMCGIGFMRETVIEGMKAAIEEENNTEGDSE